MDANQSDTSITGVGNLLLTVILSIFSWLTEPQGIDLALKFITAAGSIITGIFAVRYYWYATKEKKQKIK